ncbi:hypothetical protein [Paenibacillus ihuae]|uniref:hypothetical protein n=1 Tax=Paenibacillus ihuae TaxID=1232431 RepID=UPI0006D53AB5|nr:hypothetical protein [Paenibacillus ihuae]
MKKTIIKVGLAAAMLSGAALGQVGSAGAAATATPKPAATVKPSAAPVMTDNFINYGMTKTQNLPATITADGLSYTLHKVMIYDVNSKDARNIWKTYKFLPLNLYPKAKYLVWTKITITNKTARTIRRDMQDLSRKWTVAVDHALNNGDTTLLSPGDPKHPVNSKDLLGYFVLKPNQSLTTYEAYYVKVEPRYFFVTLANQNNLKTLYLVDPDGVGK